MSYPDQDVYLFPLSSPQQRLWFFDQITPGMPWNVPIVFRLIGRLNLAAVRQSMARIISRHETLRTTFDVVDGEPVQIVAPEMDFDVSLIDLSGITPDSVEERRAIADIVWKPFSLKTAPLLRASVLRIADEEHILVVSMHHIVSDGWSLGVFFREFTECYEAFNSGREPGLQDLPLQYGDFAVWQREMLQGGHFDRDVDYWKGQFADPPTEMELLPGFRPVAGQKAAGGCRYFELSPSLTASLKEFSQREGMTLFMTLLAAYKVLLHRYTGQSDIVVGCPSASRGRAELQELIGCFMNPLALRTAVPGELTFRQLLARVREVALDAYSHQDVPFEVVVTNVQPDRRSPLPLFQAMFIFQNFTDVDLKLETLRAIPVKPDMEGLIYPILLMVGERGGQLVGYVEFAEDRYGSILGQMPDHLEILLRALLAAPETPIAKLPILPAEDRQRLLSVWNQTTRDYPATQVHELFEEQARKRAGAVALIDDNEELTYEQLNRRANQLAHYLRGMGVGPDVLVGVALERGIDLIVALLAVLKAGGAYVPLDLAYPKDRLHLMLADSNPGLVVTTTASEGVLPEHPARTVYLDKEQSAITACSDRNPDPSAKPENLAYVIYTSGSTGVPKGVMVERRSVANYTHVASNEFHLTTQDRVLQFASVSFDTAAEEIFPCLAAGAGLVMRSEAMMNSIRDFIDHLGRAGITVLDLPTAFWHELTRVVEEDGLALPACLRLVILGGEKALAERVAAWRRVAPGVRLLNTYGPTEATIVATTCDLTARNSASDLDDPPIGRPIPNAEAYVLSQALELVPIGFPGELYIGGAGLARGYLNQPELTAEKFVVHSFDFAAGKRLYKTGDRVRYLPDGQLQYLGRMDDQVKIRGYRIELQEIETALRRHEAINGAVVIADEQQPGQKRLVAYVVPRSPQAPATAELRAHLKQSLPDFMIPAAFVVLEKLPVLPNGKVDRRSLPAPEQPASAVDVFVEPRTASEKSLAEIWARVLRVERVGINDNFFELGGDSILSIQIVAKAAQAGLRITPRDLFQHQTLRELAAVAVAHAGSDHVQPESSDFGWTQEDLDEIVAEIDPSR